MIACKEALSGTSYITAVSVLDLPIGAKIRRDADVAGIDCVDNGPLFDWVPQSSVDAGNL